MNTREPGRLADLLGSSLPFTIEEKQKSCSDRDQRPDPAREARRLPHPAVDRPGAFEQDPGPGRLRDHQGPARPLPPPADQGDPGRAGRGGIRQPGARRALGEAREGQAPRRGPRRGRARDGPAVRDAPQLGRVLDRPDVPGLARRASLGQVEPRPARPPPGPQGPRRRPLRPREDQGADPRVPGRPQAQEGHEGADPLLRRALRARARPAWARASPRPSAASSSGSAWAASTTRPRSAATAGPTSRPCPAG